MASLTREQTTALLTAARAYSERDWLLILCTYLHGLRASEAVGLRAQDIRDGFLTVRRGKKSKKTTQALIETADPLYNEKAGFAALMVGKSFECPIFGITRQAFGQLMHRHCASAGIPFDWAHPHVLKHSIAMHTIHAAGINSLQKYLGHVSMASTGQYLKVNDTTASEAIKAALFGVTA